MKKKLYIAPVVEFVDVILPPCMNETVSSPFGGDDDDERADGDNAKEQVGGSWEDIWRNM